jgi:putative transposase
MKMEIRLYILESGSFYHIYNRGINGCNVFLNNENKLFFLQKVKEHIIPVANVYAYCLMNNHFHFIIQIKENLNLLNINKDGDSTLSKFQTLTKFKDGLHSQKSIASKQIGKLISSYTQAFNKLNNRHGSLFESPFKRKRIESEIYLLQSIVYVHRNVLELNEKMEGYDFSSYKSILSDSKTLIKRKEVIEIFGNINNFRFIHQRDNSYEF